MKYLVFILICVASTALSAQAVINEESSVRALMDKFESLGKTQTTIDGWRIKIINTTDRREMERANFKFKNLFPHRTSNSSYEKPYYNIRTGAFESRLELEPYLVELKEHFRNAIPVRDKISKEEIVAAMTNG